MGKPKTGLSKKIREALRANTRPVTNIRLCEALGIPPGKDREKARNTLTDFINRGEVLITPKGRLRYNHRWKRGDKAPLKAKIAKAMYVSISEFSLAEIRERIGLKDRNYVQKAARKLVAEGHIKQVGRRLCPHGAGSERLFNIINRERFRIEVME